MSFLFKSKSKAGPPQGLPQATRNIHTSDGTPGPSNALAEKTQDRKAQSPPPNVVANGSLNSLNSLQGANTQNGPQAPFVKRERAGSEAAARPNMRPPQAPAAQQPPHDLYPWSQKQLTFQSPTQNPFPRYGVAVNGTASKEGDIYLMGGLIDGEMVRGDLWMIEAATGQLACYPIATVSEGPGPRVGHSSLLVGNAFIVFGGDTKMNDSDVLDDTLYLLNTSSRQWSRASPPGPKPAGRYGHSLNILGSKIYIFGGQVEGTFYNDLIAFDLNALQVPTNQWDFLIPNTNTDMRSPTVPPARTNHTIVSYHDMLYLFGGTDGTKWFNDVWTYDPRTNKWSQQDCIGYIPAPREGHSAALVNDVMYIFGGRTETGDDLGDLAAFKISIRRWYTFQNMGPSPSPRSGHSMTAYNKQIIVLAGEPSTTTRDAEELSMAYILDTAKIRYPPDAPMSQQKSIEPSSPTRKISETGRNMVVARSASREGQASNGQEAAQGFQGGPVQRPDTANSKIPRQSIIGAQTGPPPPNQAPNPRPNGAPQQAMAPNQGPRGKSPGEPPVLKQYTGEPPRQAPPEPSTQAREVSRQAGSRDASPAGPSSRRTASQGSVSKAKAMEAGEAAPLVGASVARQRSLRSQRAHSSLDGSEDGALGRSSSGRAPAEHRNSKSFAEEPNSPKITPHQEALMRELEATKSKNAWFASELALARKAGYTAASSPTVDERTTMQFADEDRPLVEAFMNMRNELVKMQQSMEAQAHSTAKRIAEIEHQRDAAVTEAAYARAKLAAHGGSARSTPQLGPSRDGDEADRSTDISRRLALALAATHEHKARIDTMNDELNAERRAREAAEDSAEAAQRRLNEMDSSRNTGELEGLRAELHQAQNLAREEAGQRTDMEQKLRILELDHQDLNEKHRGMSDQMTDHVGSLTALQAAVAASTSKAQLFERQVDEERGQREILEKKLSSLRGQHEEQTQELENTSRRLRETEALAETHAKEASTHREALMTGLAKISRPDSALAQDAKHDGRVAALQQSTDKANALAKANQQAADASAQKLRSAEERIAGLEAYQEQSSREGLSVRRQLQSALRDLQNHQNDNRELRALLESHQRDASALAVQHGALKDLLGERGVDMSTARRSPNSDRPSSRFDTPDIQQMRELREQLQSSMKAHEDTKMMFESREHEAEKAYRERLEQLENDYQSLLTYVKGTERMLKRMKEELTKYKAANQKLMNELESTKDGKRSAGSIESSDPEAWTAERDALQSSIDDIRAQMATQIEQLEANMAHVKGELVTAQADRDQQKASHEALQKSVQLREKELSELKSENSMLEQRALDAEDRVTMLLDQVGSSVNSYRRQSQLQPLAHAADHVPTGGHQHQPSASTMTDTSSHTDGEGPEETRGSVALDNLASELETLKAQWESQSRNYRLSDRFDFERTPTRETAGSANASGSDLSSAMAGWRQGLAGGDQHESSNAGPNNRVGAAAAVAAAGNSH